MATITPLTTNTKNGATLVIQAASESHAASSLALYRAVLEEGVFTMLEPNELTRSEEQEAEAIRTDGEHPARLRLVALAGETLTGMVRVACGDLARTAHFGDIDSMRVLPDWRRQGVGGALLDTLIEWAAAQPQIEKLGLYVFSTSKAAIQLYRSRGFIEEGRGVRDIKFCADEYADTVMMGYHIPREAP